MIGEQTNTDPVRRYVVSSLTPQGFVEEGTSYDYLIDHLYTAHEVVDDTGVTVWQGDYASESFGEVNITTEVVTNNLRFPGQYADAESGLYYNWFRYYDPTIGIYTQSDSIGLDGGTNTYAYAYQNSLYYIDPDGRIAFVALPIFAGGGAFAGSGFWVGGAIVGGGILVGSIPGDTPGDDTGGEAGQCPADNDKPKEKRPKENFPPYDGPPNGYKEGPRRGREYGPDGKPIRDYDRPHQGADYPHVHEWPNGKREHPGREYSPIPKR